MAFFHKSGNSANFALVPHVHLFANSKSSIQYCSNYLRFALLTNWVVGIVSGLTGAAGNFGGVIFAIFRYHGKNYARVFWIAGIIHIAINLSVIWIKSIIMSQIAPASKFSSIRYFVSLFKIGQDYLALTRK